MINALDDEQVTQDLPDEADSQLTDNQAEDGETQPEKETESPEQIKNVQAAIQKARERENAEREKAQRLQADLDSVNSRLEELELQGLNETEQYRIKAERAEARAKELEEKIQVEEVKKDYRAFLSEMETDHPKSVATLKKLMDKDIYPVQGATTAEFQANFLEYASLIEGDTKEEIKGAASNPAYNPPDELDFNSLSPADMRKMLPIADKD